MPRHNDGWSPVTPNYPIADAVLGEPCETTDWQSIRPEDIERVRQLAEETRKPIRITARFDGTEGRIVAMEAMEQATMDPITYLDRTAEVIEIVSPPGSRGSADCVLSVPLTNGAWEMDIAMLADFGLTPTLGIEYSADILEEDRLDANGQPNGRSVTVVGLREV